MKKVFRIESRSNNKGISYDIGKSDWSQTFDNHPWEHCFWGGKLTDIIQIDDGIPFVADRTLFHYAHYEGDRIVAFCSSAHNDGLRRKVAAAKKSGEPCPNCGFDPAIR